MYVEPRTEQADVAGTIVRSRAGAARAGLRRLADARELLAGQPVDDAVAAEPGAHLHEAVRIADDLADDRRLPAERMRAHGRQQPFRVLRRAEGDELALVGDVQRI